MDILLCIIETFLILVLGSVLIDLDFMKKLFRYIFVSICVGIFLKILKTSYHEWFLIGSFILLIIMIYLFITKNFIKSILISLVGLISILILELVTFILLKDTLLVQTNMMHIFHFILGFTIFLICRKYNICFIKMDWYRTLHKTNLFRLKFSEDYVIYSTLLFLLSLSMIMFFFRSISPSSIMQSEKLYIFSLVILFIAIFLIIIARKMLFLGSKQTLAIEEKIQNKQLQTYVDYIKEQKHDFNYHVNALYGMLINKKYDDCLKYMEKIVFEVNILNETLYLNDNAIAAMILSFKQNAVKKNIQFHTITKNNLSYIPCTAYEFNRILANLIKNAFEAVEGQQEPIVILEFLIVNDQNLIKISNTGSIDERLIEKVYNTGFSTKKNSNNQEHGYGLTIVKRYVEDLEGEIFIECKKNMTVFNVFLPLKN